MHFVCQLDRTGFEKEYIEKPEFVDVIINNKVCEIAKNQICQIGNRKFVKIFNEIYYYDNGVYKFYDRIDENAFYIFKNCVIYFSSDTQQTSVLTADASYITYKDIRSPFEIGNTIIYFSKKGHSFRNCGGIHFYPRNFRIVKKITDEIYVIKCSSKKHLFNFPKNKMIIRNITDASCLNGFIYILKDNITYKYSLKLPKIILFKDIFFSFTK